MLSFWNHRLPSKLLGERLLNTAIESLPTVQQKSRDIYLVNCDPLWGMTMEEDYFLVIDPIPQKPCVDSGKHKVYRLPIDQKLCRIDIWGDNVFDL